MIDEKTVRDRIIEENIGLVHACAGRFRGKGIEYDDLFQAGCVGLCKAAEGFDPDKGYAFSTYAVPTILGEIRRLFRDGGAIKVGRRLKEKAREMLRLQQTLTVRLGREPCIGELAECAGTDAAQAAFLLNAAIPPLSLTSEDAKHERQIDVPTPSPAHGIETHLSLWSALDGLEERERLLIEMRYFQGFTQTVTAQKMGISQVQVSRTEKEILQKLRILFSD